MARTHVLIFSMFCLCAFRAGANGPIRLAGGPNLFIDDYLIGESKNLARTTHQPEKRPAPILPKAETWHEMPLFFLRVIYDPQARIYRMWYNIRNNTKGYPGTVYAYAESQDGVEWQRPNLGLIGVAGSTNNNLFKVVPAFGLGFVDDGPRAPDPERRYKFAYYHLRKPEGMFVAFSRDGLHFKDWPENPVLTELSDIIDACWDPHRKQYLAIFKANSVPEDGYKGSTPNAPEGYRRLVGQSLSKDFIHWSKARRIVVADPREPGVWEFYGASPQVRGNLYLGFLRVLRDDLPEGRTGQKGIGWTELITSRDGENWTRHREPFIDRNPEEGTFDRAMAWFGDSITVGDQEHITSVRL